MTLGEFDRANAHNFAKIREWRLQKKMEEKDKRIAELEEELRKHSAEKK